MPEFFQGIGRVQVNAHIPANGDLPVVGRECGYRQRAPAQPGQGAFRGCAGIGDYLAYWRLVRGDRACQSSINRRPASNQYQD